jgi:predicted flap endonuclease-1-like 5' DNA nuclease
MMIRTTLGLLAGLVLAIAGVVLFIWILWRLWSQSDKGEELPAIEIKAEPLAVEADVEEEIGEAEPEPEEEEVEEVLEEMAPSEPVEPDDLKRIEGIGPKIAGVLQDAGIATYAQLADTDVSDLEQILEKADPRLLRLAKPESWPEQAALAKTGEWEALEALQKGLKGGKRG